VRSSQPVRRAVCGTDAFLAVQSFTRPILKVDFGSKPVRQIELGTYRGRTPGRHPGRRSRAARRPPEGRPCVLSARPETPFTGLAMRESPPRCPQNPTPQPVIPPNPPSSPSPPSSHWRARIFRAVLWLQPNKGLAYRRSHRILSAMEIRNGQRTRRWREAPCAEPIGEIEARRFFYLNRL
jgi:hypothetical protein